MSIPLCCSSDGRLKRPRHQTTDGAERLRESLPYGLGSLPLHLDTANAQRLSPRTLGVHPEPRKAIRRALGDPIGQQDIRPLISPGASTAIILDCHLGLTDITEVVDAVSEAFGSREGSDRDVSYIVSSSAGRMAARQFTSEINKCTSLQSDEVLLHNPDREGGHIEVGVSPSVGNRILVDETVVGSDLVVSVGSVIQDSFAGATGGRMAILPGVSHRQTINRNKSQQGIDGVCPFNLQTKSCMDMIEASQMAGLTLSVNLVYDRMGNLASVRAGAPEESWLQAVEDAKQLALTAYTEAGDVVIVSAGGYPFDLTLYDAVDSLFAASRVCRRDGVIVLVAECSQGVGPKGFVEGISQSGSQADALLRIQTGYSDGMEKSRYFWRILENHRLVICSRLRRSHVEERLYADAVKDPQEALELAKNYAGIRPKVTVIECGNMTYPSYVSKEQ